MNIEGTQEVCGWNWSARLGNNAVSEYGYSVTNFPYFQENINGCNKGGEDGLRESSSIFPNIGVK